MPFPSSEEASVEGSSHKGFSNRSIFYTVEKKIKLNIIIALVRKPETCFRSSVVKWLGYAFKYLKHKNAQYLPLWSKLNFSCL